LAVEYSESLPGDKGIADEAGQMIGRSPPPVETENKPKGFDDFDLRLGDIMRGERATLGKSLLDVQRELKIKASYIAAIENADPSAFETQGFVAGYVRSYARYLGLDPEWAYGKFCEEGHFAVPHGMSAAASAPRPGRPAPVQGVRDPFANPNTPFAPRAAGLMSRVEPGALGSLAVLMVLIAGLGYGGWSVLQEVQKVQFAPVDQAPGVVAEVGAISATGEVQAATSDIAQVQAPNPEALDRLYRPQALDVPVLVARDGPISALAPRREPRDDRVVPVAADAVDLAVAEAMDLAVAEAMEAAPAVPQVVEADVPQVVMFAVRPSWVRVQAADGTVLFEKILDAGEKYVLPKTEEAPLLRSGNAGSVYFAVNGQNYGPAGVGASVVKNVALSVEALTTAFAVADLTADSDLADFVALADARAGETAAEVPTE
jgi:cytoskeletal protein RodZ